MKQMIKNYKFVSILELMKQMIKNYKFVSITTTILIPNIVRIDSVVCTFLWT